MKKKTWRQLQKGEKFYIVNEGVGFGVRIEICTATDAIKKHPDIDEWYTLEYDELPGLPIQMLEKNLDETSFGYIFTTLEEAEDKFVQLAPEWIGVFRERCEKLINSLSQNYTIKESMQMIMDRIKERKK